MPRRALSLPPTPPPNITRTGRVVKARSFLHDEEPSPAVQNPAAPAQSVDIDVEDTSAARPSVQLQSTKKKRKTKEPDT